MAEHGGGGGTLDWMRGRRHAAMATTGGEVREDASVGGKWGFPIPHHDGHTVKFALAHDC